MEFLGKNTIKLCRKGSCCPIVERVTEDEYTIADDYNGKVKLTKDQLQMVKESLEYFEQNPEV